MTPKTPKKSMSSTSRGCQPVSRFCRARYLAQHDEEHKADQIHQPVPAHGERPDVKRDRIELRVDQHR